MDHKINDDKAVPVPGLVFQGWEIAQEFSAGPVGRRTVTAIGRRGELVLKASGADSDIARDMLGDMIRKHRE
jgi:hypothetical protein